ncbi:hypothetical protein [Actinoplanes sp. NPDC026619]|uniref:hypothetical protein n=1 Tax=Actinoplanes sp. NPDC026619 TaxID=3155798 RepID=UPI0034075467
MPDPGEGPGKGCKKVKGDKTRVRCTPKKTPIRVRVYTYDRNDSIVDRTDLAMTADGGTGNDRIAGGPRGDRGKEPATTSTTATTSSSRSSRTRSGSNDWLDGRDAGTSNDKDLLDGGANTEGGDSCATTRSDTTVGCEVVN